MFNSFLSLFLIYNYGKNNFINKNVVNDTLIITNENNMNNLGLCEIPFNDDIEDDLMKISEYFYKSKLLKSLPTKRGQYIQQAKQVGNKND